MQLIVLKTGQDMIPVENYVACDLIHEILLYVKTMLVQHFRFDSSTDIFILLLIKKIFIQYYKLTGSYLFSLTDISD